MSKFNSSQTLSTAFIETSSHADFTKKFNTVALPSPRIKVAKVDLEKLKAIRSSKQLLKNRLRNYDPERTLSLPIRTFELEAYKVGITLQNKDMDFIIKNLTDLHKPHCILYEEVVRILVPQIREDKQIKWTIKNQKRDERNENQTKLNGQNGNNTFQQRKSSFQDNSSQMGNSDLRRSFQNLNKISQSRMSFNQQPINQQPNNFKTMFAKINDQRKLSQTRPSSRENLVQDKQFMSQTFDNSQLFKKITIGSSINELQSYVSKDLSSGSKQLNIYKNKQNAKYIKASIINVFNHEEKEYIRKYLKKDNIDIRHLNDIKSAFLSCQQINLGQTKKSDLLIKLYKMNLKFPQEFFLQLLKTIQEDLSDTSDDAILSYNRLRAVMDVYISCPSRLKGDSNNSNSFKVSLEYQTDIKGISNDKTDKLVRYVHMRIEEKFKDFRHAFRSFDRNYDGNLSFKEFMSGLENIGIRLNLEDFLKIFQVLDYNQTNDIDFSKFCLLNTDKMKDTHNYLTQLKQQQSLDSTIIDPSSQSSHMKRKKPPLPQMMQSHLRESLKEKLHSQILADGLVPKNKDYSGFTHEVQQPTLFELHKKLRRNIKLPEDQEFSFGLKNEFDHDMQAIMSNLYQNDLDSSQKRISTKNFTHSTLNKSANRLFSKEQSTSKAILKQRIASGFRDKFVNLDQKRQQTASSSVTKLKIPFSHNNKINSDLKQRVNSAGH
eukprot:403346767